MSCGCNKCCNQEPLEDNEIYCCGQLYQYTLTTDAGNNQSLLCTPCNQPTAIFDVASITTKTNACMGVTYYQAVVNTDPVEIIQDCNLKNTVCRCIELYMKDNACGCGCQSSCQCNKGFSLF